MMDVDQSKGTESPVSNDSKVRRTFLKRATAGAVIVSIPGRSAWAGIASSIVASGHGSDWNGGTCTELLSQVFWKNHEGDWAVDTTTTFFAAFGGEPIMPADDTAGKTLLEVLNNPGGKPNEGLGGPNNVNVQMVAMYLNAAHFAANPVPNSLGIFYPAVQQHGSLAAYGSYLYAEASSDPAGVGILLSETIDKYHVGTSMCI